MFFIYGFNEFPDYDDLDVTDDLHDLDHKDHKESFPSRENIRVTSYLGKIGKIKIINLGALLLHMAILLKSILQLGNIPQRGPDREYSHRNCCAAFPGHLVQIAKLVSMLRESQAADLMLRIAREKRFVFTVGWQCYPQW